MKLFRKQVLVIILFFIPFTGIKAQPGDPGDDPGNPVPISGIEILIALGALFGAKKVYDIRKKR